MGKLIQGAQYAEAVGDKKYLSLSSHPEFVV